jgi:hypothetical protein
MAFFTVSVDNVAQFLPAETDSRSPMAFRPTQQSEQGS